MENSKRHEYFNTQSRAFESLQYFTIRRFVGYWNRALMSPLMTICLLLLVLRFLEIAYIKWGPDCACQPYLPTSTCFQLAAISRQSSLFPRHRSSCPMNIYHCKYLPCNPISMKGTMWIAELWEEICTMYISYIHQIYVIKMRYYSIFSY